MFLGRLKAWILIPVVPRTALQVWGESLTLPCRPQLLHLFDDWVGLPGTLPGPFQLQPSFLSVVIFSHFFVERDVWDVCSRVSQGTRHSRSPVACSGTEDPPYRDPLPPAVGGTLSPSCARLAAQGCAEAGAGFRLQLLTSALLFFQPFIHPSPEISLS